MLVKRILLSIAGLCGLLFGIFLWWQNKQLVMEFNFFDDLSSRHENIEKNFLDIPKDQVRPIIPEMVRVPAGEFMMGARPQDKSALENERPSHKVIIAQAFDIGKYEVSFDEYDAFARLTDRPFPSDHQWGRGRRPVINVSWHDAVAFTVWLTQQTQQKFRLPTEAEWEYVARAHTQTVYWWGDTLLANKAQCSDCKMLANAPGTATVGRFDANPFGVFDTAGNVTEWTMDCYQPDYLQRGADAAPFISNPCLLRSIRGGSWYNQAITLRSSHRSGLSPDHRENNGGGFRVARDIPP